MVYHTGGFCRFVPSANTFVRYDGIGLSSNVIYRIEEEDEKGLFLGFQPIKRLCAF